MTSGRRFVLRQVQVLHRHGDRSPLSNVFEGSTVSLVEDETQLWMRKLPNRTQREKINSLFPLKHLVQVKLQTLPFGCLTTTGVEQMHTRGKQLAASCAHSGFPIQKLSQEDMHIYCNAFWRTQMSVQALLTGVFSTDLPHSDPLIHVLPPDNDMIHTYSVYPEISQLKTSLETEDDELREREEMMVEQKTELLARLPLFRAGNKSFMWMTCADYFMCRKAHNIPFIQSTEHLYDTTMQHIAFRFYRFYSDRRIRSLVAGQLMEHIINEMDKVMHNTSTRKKLIIYSGHDVSILATLHAIDAVIAQNKAWWPPYASALIVELLQDEDSGEWFVQTRFDGESPLLLRPFDSTAVDYKSFVQIVNDRIDPL